MEQLFMLVFMVILIGVAIFFGIKESRELEKEKIKNKKILIDLRKKLLK